METSPIAMYGLGYTFLVVKSPIWKDLEGLSNLQSQNRWRGHRGNGGCVTAAIFAQRWFSSIFKTVGETASYRFIPLSRMPRMILEDGF